VSPDLGELIERLARARGIGDAYHTYQGELRHFSLTTKAAILRAMHCSLDAAPALQAQIDESEAAHPSGLLGDVVVSRPGARIARINTPAIEQNARLRWTVRLEDGSERSGEARAWDLPERGSHSREGRWHVLRDLPLPADLPSGYHRLQVDLEFAGRESCALIVAPDKCHEPAELVCGAKSWGVAVQLYALRSADNWGIGDFTDLAILLRHAADAGARFVGISPVHALFPADPTLYSPYSASSRHALNVMFIDVSNVLEVQSSRRAQALMADAGFRARLARVRAATHIDYPAVASLKMSVLDAAYDRFRTEHLARHTARAAACRGFLRERGEAMRLHTLFDAIDTHLRRHHGTAAGWHNWPEEYRRPDSEAVRRFAQTHADEVDFHGYLQWLAAEQFGAVRSLARELGLAIGIYGDYAVGVNASGSETWSDQTLYCMGASIGAPPDPLGPAGQEWGIPPQDPYVHYPLEDLLAVVALESHRNQCLVVGEDLGVVPDEIRRALPEFGVYHYKVVMFEQKNGEFVPPGAYTRHALATVTTHDLPTLHGWWSGHDIDLWEKLEFYADSSVAAQARAERGAARERLLRALRREGLWPEDAVVPEYSAPLGQAVHVYLGRSQAALVTVQLEDMIGMLEPVNLPGTSTEYSNWTRRMTASASEIFARDDVRALAAAMHAARAG
jgi:4-alpha-glucanotransferase